MIEKKKTKEDKRVRVYKITSKGQKEFQKTSREILKIIGEIEKKYRDPKEDLKSNNLKKIFQRYNNENKK